jgi:uncharacterized protein (TIGR02001 family)
MGPCSVSANVGYTSDYVFRGVSQSGEDPAIQGGVDFTCGRFYVGTWGSSVAFAGGAPEIDVYGGFKHVTGPISWDFGFIYYSYPGASSTADLDFFEFKVSGSGEVWKGGTLTGTLFYSPEFTSNTGEALTVEATFAQALPRVAIFSPTFSATIGNISFQEVTFGGEDEYTYWNVGVALGFYEKWTLDLRYWDTDDNNVSNFFGPSDGRFVGTIKYTF